MAGERQPFQIGRLPVTQPRCLNIARPHRLGKTAANDHIGLHIADQARPTDGIEPRRQQLDSQRIAGLAKSPGRREPIACSIDIDFQFAQALRRKIDLPFAAQRLRSKPAVMQIKTQGQH